MSDLYDKAVLLKENIALKKKIAELEAQIEREREAFEGNQQKREGRIAELESVLNMSEDSLVHEVIAAKGLRAIAENKVAELQAQNRIFRSTESVDDSVWNALLEQVRQLQFQLAAAEAKYDQLCADLSGQTDRAVQAEYKHTALIESLKGLADEMRSQSNKSTDCYTDLRGFADHMSAICTRR